MGTRGLKKQVALLLARPNFKEILAALSALPPRELVNSLISSLCARDESARAHAVRAMGPVVAALAAEDMEAARVVMRRLLWSLNDESGGIGWGAPAAMAEIMACHPGLAEEYLHMLLSYMRKDGDEIWQDGNFLEHELLQRDLLRGIGRLATVMPDELRRRGATTDLPPYLDSPDPEIRALAARVLGLLQAEEALSALETLSHDQAEVRGLDQADGGGPSTVGQVAQAAMVRIRGAK